jgi:hypothetical protein
MMKIAGSGSGFINQRHGSADPDPHQNVMDPEHCYIAHSIRIKLKVSISIKIICGLGLLREKIS